MSGESQSLQKLIDDTVAILNGMFKKNPKYESYYAHGKTEFPPDGQSEYGDIFIESETRGNISYLYIVMDESINNDVYKIKYRYSKVVERMTVEIERDKLDPRLLASIVLIGMQIQ